MPEIVNAITQRNYELVRDRIANILAIELPNQVTLNAGGAIELENPTIEVERFTPVKDTELPLVNVMLGRGDYGMFTPITQDGTFIYHIDVYSNANFTATDRGDKIAFQKLQRLVGVVQAILSDAKYRTLGFAPPSLERVQVNNIKFAEPANNKDSTNSVMGRLEFSVRVADSVEVAALTLIGGYDTSVLIGSTDQGYVFSGNNAPIPAPSCAPADVRNTDDTYTAEYPSGEYSTIPNTLVVLKDTGGGQISSNDYPSAKAGGYNLIAPDAIITVKNSLNNTVDSGLVVAGGNGVFNAPNGNVKIFKSDGTSLIENKAAISGDTVNTNIDDSVVTVNTESLANVKATDPLDIPVHNTAGTDVGTVAAGVVNIANTTITLNTNEATSSVLAEGSKNFNLLDQIGRPILVDSVSGDDITLSTKSGTQTYKTGQTVLVVADDDSTTQRGAGVDWWNLSHPNFFGHTKRFTGTTGGYWDEVALNYKDVNGAVTTNLLAFPEDIVLDWSQFDVETGDVKGLYRSINNVDVNYSQNETYVTGLTTASWSGFIVPNIDEFWRWAHKSNQGAALDRALLYEPLISVNSGPGGIGTGSFIYWSSTINSDSRAKILVNNYATISRNPLTISSGCRSFAIRIFNISEL